MVVTHDATTWFNGILIYEYFNTTFKQNIMKTLKFNERILSYWVTPTMTPAELLTAYETLTQSLGEIAITMIVNAPNAKVLSMLPFDYILAEDQELLRQTVCEIIQNMSANNQVLERLQGVGVSSSNFNITTDLTNWLLKGDPFGIYAKQLIYKSGITRYKIIQDWELFQITKGGNYQVIKKIGDII